MCNTNRKSPVVPVLAAKFVEFVIKVHKEGAINEVKLMCSRVGTADMRDVAISKAGCTPCHNLFDVIVEHGHLAKIAQGCLVEKPLAALILIVNKESCIGATDHFVGINAVVDIQISNDIVVPFPVSLGSELTIDNDKNCQNLQKT